MKVIQSHSIPTPSGIALSITGIEEDEGKELVEKYEGKLIKQFSNPRCESYYYLLSDNRVVHMIPAGLEASIYEPYDAFLSYMEESHIMKRTPDTFPIPGVRRLPGGRKIWYYFIDKAALEKLLAEEMSFRLERNVIQLRDGRILINKNNSGELYSNLEEYQAFDSFRTSYHRYISRKLRGDYSGIIEPTICGLNTFGEAFPAHVDELAARLPALLEAPEVLFNGKIENLPRIDKFLYKNPMTPAFEEKVFLPLIAFIGKSYISYSGGEWVMLHDEVSSHWIPDLRKADGEMKMLYHTVSIILDPNGGHGIYIPLKSLVSS